MLSARFLYVTEAITIFMKTLVPMNLLKYHDTLMYVNIPHWL